MEAGAIAAGHAHAHDEHHGPPEAHRSSRVEPQLLGMLLFIISEVMVFGAFFTAYFFIRVVANDPWPAPGTELPKLIAGMNTAVLLSSSITMHWALESAKRGNRFGLQAGILTTFLLGATFLFVQINEYVHIGFSPSDSAQGSIFYGLTGLHGRARVHRADAAGDGHERAPSAAISPPSSTAASRCPGIYWHFVDIMWVIVYTSVYIL
jgi:cytochrome c oxidase subunit 3